MLVAGVLGSFCALARGALPGDIEFFCCASWSSCVMQNFRVNWLTSGADGTVPVQRQAAKSPRCPNPRRRTMFLSATSSIPRVWFIPSLVESIR
jgi:hypothetical protein